MRILPIVALVATFAIVNEASPQTTSNVFTSQQDWGRLSWRPHDSALNMAGYRKVWGDEFDTCDIGEDSSFQSRSVRPDAKSSERHRWYITREKYGLAQFVGTDATPSPYACQNGILNITLSNPTGQQWQSGILSADGSAHRGFTRNDPYSYFEARLKLPPPPAGLIPWPAFWFRSGSAVSRGRDSVLEVDVLESGNASPTDLTMQATTIHEWPAHQPRAGEITERRSIGYNDRFETFDGQWHSYGLLRTPRWFIIYIDGKEQRRFPSVGREMRAPIYPILDVALKYPPTGGTDASYTMQVDYVRAYACGAGGRGGRACTR